jgi:hypothetical protein
MPWRGLPGEKAGAPGRDGRQTRSGTGLTNRLLQMSLHGRPAQRRAHRVKCYPSARPQHQPPSLMVLRAPAPGGLWGGQGGGARGPGEEGELAARRNT